jgi:hypothetical protein
MNQNQGIPTAALIMKIAALLGTALLCESIFRQHATAAYEAGLVAGVLLQSLIPPRHGWRVTLLLAIVLPLIGGARFLIH